MIRSVTYEFEVIDVRGGAFGGRFPSNFDAVVFVIDNSVIVQQLKFEVCRAWYQFDIECRRLVSPPPVPPMLIVKCPGHIFETCFDDTKVLNIFSSDARGELVAGSC